MNEKSLALVSVIAAFVASLCCLGPLVLGGIGLGAALVATFAPLRPYFLALSAILLAGGFYFAYRKPRPTQACAGEVCVPQNRTRWMAKPFLWLATVAIAALALFPSYAGKLIGKAATPATPQAPLATIELHISGMTCQACAALVQKKVLEIPGVATAEVDFGTGRAAIQYNPARVGPAELIAGINATGYKAELPAASEPKPEPQAGARFGYQILDANLEILRERFNQDAGHLRVLMLLSPT